MSDFLDEKRREINERLAELKPLVEEHQRLEAAVAALRGLDAAAPGDGAATPVRRGPGRPRRDATAAPTTQPATRASAGRPSGTARRRPGRRKGSGTRAAQAFALVQQQPGITIPELAARMGIKQNYLYRVLPALEQEAKVVKRGRGWEPR